MKRPFFFPTLFFAAGLLLSEAAAVPRIIREVLETNTQYLSGPASKTVLTGGAVRITNHISRRGYNVGGKIVKIRVIPEEAGMLSIEGMPPVEEPDLASVYETGDKPGPDPAENADRAQIRRHDNPPSEGPAVQGKTDLYGRIHFLLKPRPGYRGPVDVQVYFVNQTTGFAEHTALHRIEVVSRPLALLEGAITAVALLAVLLLAFLGQRASWRPQSPNHEEALLPWTTLLLPPRTTSPERRRSLLMSWSAGAVATALLLFLPNPVWGLATALTLILMATLRHDHASHPTVLFVAVALWWAALGMNFSQPFSVLSDLLPEASWMPWVLAPALSILAPNPVLSLPLLFHAMLSHLVSPIQAVLGLVPLIAGSLWILLRKRAA